MNLLCFLKHLLERRIARRREARRSDRLQRATPPRQRPQARRRQRRPVPTIRLKTYMEACYAGCSAVAATQDHGRAVAQSRNTHPSTPLPRAADAHAIDVRTHMNRNNKNHIYTRTQGVGRRCSRAGIRIGLTAPDRA